MLIKDVQWFYWGRMEEGTFYRWVQEPLQENFKIRVVKSAFSVISLNNDGFKFSS